MDRSFQEVLENQNRRIDEAMEQLKQLQGSVPQESVQEFLDAMDAVDVRPASVGAIQHGIRA